MKERNIVYVILLDRPTLYLDSCIIGVTTSEDEAHRLVKQVSAEGGWNDDDFIISCEPIWKSGED